MSNIDERYLADQFAGTGSFVKATPKAIVESLPVRVITEEQIAANASGQDEAMTKCMVLLLSPITCSTILFDKINENICLPLFRFDLF